MTDKGEAAADAKTELDEFWVIVSELNKESDRAAVILAVAKLDLLLYQILQATLLPSTGTQDELLDGDSALGTLSARINIVHRLGLIDSEFTHALHIARRIRNSFAHELSSSTLNLGSHRDRVRELCAPFRRFKRFDSFRKSFAKKEEDTPSTNFRTAIAIMVLRLDSLCDESVPIAGKSPTTLVYDGWDKSE